MLLLEHSPTNNVQLLVHDTRAIFEIPTNDLSFLLIYHSEIHFLLRGAGELSNRKLVLFHADIFRNLLGAFDRKLLCWQLPKIFSSLYNLHSTILSFIIYYS